MVRGFDEIALAIFVAFIGKKMGIYPSIPR